MRPRRASLLVFVALVAACAWVADSPRLLAQASCEQPYAPIFALRAGSQTILDGEEVWTNLGQHQVWPEEPVEDPGVSFVEVTDWSTVEWSLDADGDLVTVTGEHAGEYAIPASIGPVPSTNGLLYVTQKGRYLALLHVLSTGGRPFPLLVLWDVEEPCRALPVLVTSTTTSTATTASSTTTPAPGPAPTPAVPVRGAASYTG